MVLGLLFQNPPEFFLIFAGLILAIGLHEAAHCYMADRLGDPTPRSLGRLSLNPLVHLDPLGTLAILVAGFGWGKPAPFDPYNLSNPRRDIALIALAGPVTNILQAIVFAVVYHLASPPILVSQLLFNLIYLNLSLAVFNLLPIPPLDGSKIFLPRTRMNPQTGYFLLIFLMMTGILSRILGPIVSILASLLL